MPELPEVETVMQGLTPHILGAVIQDVVVRKTQLRWPIPSTLQCDLRQQTIRHLSRRGKYLLMQVDNGTVIMHLGMSGSLRIVTGMEPVNRHDHVDIILSNQKIIRYTDPRRFGALLWTMDDPNDHPLIKSLGIEPLSLDFTAAYLMNRAAARRLAIKPFIMDSKIVVGVGNIYATEALFLAGIHPTMPAGLLSFKQYDKLVEIIKQVLQAAIKQGGTTIKDFINSAGKPGYFSQQLMVYGRAGMPCVQCQKPLQSLRIGQRSTVFCTTCQSDFPEEKSQ